MGNNSFKVGQFIEVYNLIFKKTNIGHVSEVREDRVFCQSIGGKKNDFGFALKAIGKVVKIKEVIK